jgi:fructose-specific phosphotransferase system IIC component
MQFLKDLRQHLLTGVSHAIPFIAAGGILIALSLAFAPMGGKGPDMDAIEPAWLQSALKLTLQIGVAAFTLMLPVLAAYISYSIAGKPGLTAGAIGGLLCGHVADVTRADGSQAVSAGFLGAIVAGLLAGYIVKWLKSLPMHKYVKPIMPILIIPVVSSVVVGALMLKVIGPPIGSLMASLGDTLQSMQTGSAVLLACVLGGMIAFDMGGPVNKAAFFFASGLIAQGNTTMMGPVAAAICIPPLGLGLATLINRKIWSDEQRESGIAALGMGTIGITEGAIPFAAADPFRIIPCIMAGSMVGSTIAMLAGVGGHAPHGGLIVLPVIDNRIMYVVAIASGVVVTALAVHAVKRFTAAKNPSQPA